MGLSIQSMSRKSAQPSGSSCGSFTGRPVKHRLMELSGGLSWAGVPLSARKSKKNLGSRFNPSAATSTCWRVTPTSFTAAPIRASNFVSGNLSVDSTSHIVKFAQRHHWLCYHHLAPPCDPAYEHHGSPHSHEFYFSLSLVIPTH